MLKVRIIPTILISHGRIVKTINYKNPRIVGDAISTIKVFTKRMADEMIVVDINAYNNGINFELITNFTKFCNMPLAVGGGIKSLDDAKKIFELGVEKIVIGNSFYSNPSLITQISKNFGASSIVFSLDVNIDHNNEYRAFYNSGKKMSDKKIDKIIYKTIELGVGEIMINSIHRDGTYKGYDLNLFNFVNSISSVPIILNCGCGTKNHCLEAFNSGAQAISASSIFFWIGESIISIKDYLKTNKINVRTA